VEADSLLNLGNVAWRRGHYAEAQAFFEQALQLYRAIGDRRGECGAVLNFGIVTFEQGDYGGARPHFAQALSLYRAIGDRRGENLSLNDLGVVAETQGDYAEAEAYYRQFLQLARETGDREAKALRSATSAKSLVGKAIMPVLKCSKNNLFTCAVRSAIERANVCHWSLWDCSCTRRETIAPHWTIVGKDCVWRKRSALARSRLAL